MESSATWYGPVSPQSRALRRVVVLNAEIAYEIRRILGLKGTDYAAMAMLIVHSMGPRNWLTRCTSRRPPRPRWWTDWCARVTWSGSPWRGIDVG